MQPALKCGAVISQSARQQQKKIHRCLEARPDTALFVPQCARL
ncbi:hypothetical protein [Paractinoplanes hotanensis]|nr:hypothetical protein [Actinoplanes hotanensis]